HTHALASTRIQRIHINDLALPSLCSRSLFFFTDPAPTEIYTLSLHDALPISRDWRSFPMMRSRGSRGRLSGWSKAFRWRSSFDQDRKSTRLNSSHVEISYAVFCLKKKKNITPPT